LVLGAAAAAGSPAAFAGCLVVGSYLVQTHLATAPVVAAVVVLAAARGLRGASRRRLGVLVGAGVVLAALWVPPLVQQFRGSPANLSATVRFFTTSHPDQDAGVDHRLATAAGQTTAELAVLPAGRTPRPGLLPPAGPGRWGVVVAGLLVAAGVAVAGWRRRRSFLAALGAVSLAGTAVAMWSTTRIVGPVLPYLLLWTSVLLLPAWIGAVVLVAPGPVGAERAAPRRALGWGLDLVAVALAAALGWSMARAPLPPVPHDPRVAGVERLARPWLEQQHL